MKGTHKRLFTIAGAALAAVTFLSGCGAAGGDTPDGPAEEETVEVDWTAPALFTDLEGNVEQDTYEPIPVDEISQTWNVCVLFPHVKDPYWLATNYGTLIEGQRDGVEYQMFEAGGYDNLDKQVTQMEDCITQGFDAIILGAISANGLCTQIASAIDKGIPVVDFINGTDCPDSLDSPLFSHALVSFHDLAVTTAEYLIEHNELGDRHVGFFPGPEGAGWSDAAVEGFNKTIEGTNTSVDVMRRADTGLDTQLALIEDSLKAYPDINTIVGVDIAAEAGVVAVRNANLTDSVEVYAFDIIPGVYDAILAGDAVGSPTDYTTIQGRMAMDHAIRMLEGQELRTPTSGPIPEMITAENAETIEYTLMFAPRDFEATFTWSPES